jgi:protein involved in polysaccharide export with SLBB domain
LRGVVIPPLALEDGDSVVVDSVTGPDASLYVTIGGMVRKPGRYPWREGMTLKDLVLLARGPTVGAYLVEAEIGRLPEDRTGGQLAETVRVPLDSSYLIERDSTGRYVGPPGTPAPPPGTAAEVLLRPYDAVTILRQPEFDLQRTVVIDGEVRFPGPYVLTRKDERLSDLVRRAGGLLPSAFVDGARLVRPFAGAGRVDIRLADALRNPGGPGDPMLNPGDTVVVPEYVATVRVEGAVNTPTSVLYRPGTGLGYYIENAGGYTRNADKGRVHVTYANGSARVKSRFLIFSSEPEPGPGSVITVPAKPEGQPFNPTQFLANLAQIAASVVAIIAIATRP